MSGERERATYLRGQGAAARKTCSAVQPWENPRNSLVWPRSNHNNRSRAGDAACLEFLGGRLSPGPGKTEVMLFENGHVKLRTFVYEDVPLCSRAKE